MILDHSCKPSQLRKLSRKKKDAPLSLSPSTNQSGCASLTLSSVQQLERKQTLFPPLHSVTNENGYTISTFALQPMGKDVTFFPSCLPTTNKKGCTAVIPTLRPIREVGESQLCRTELICALMYQTKGEIVNS
jgi:hypothetical protein